jgi:phospholipid/cholesterol/gamma-HCH transport system substrate-binding protein
VALFLLVILGLSTGFVVISRQQASLPAWVPVLGKDFFEMEAAFSTSQAITPGQGQAAVIAGIRVGQVAEVHLEEGQAIVGLDIENEYRDLIHSDASLLLRPKTNLNDMVIEIDPGVAEGSIEEGHRIPESQTEPNINPDQFIAALDTDTRQYLQALLQAGGEGLGGVQKGKQLSSVFRRFEPFVRDIAKINGAVAQRREQLKRVIHNFGVLTEELSRTDTQVERWISSSNGALGHFANESDAISAAIRRLPGALEATRAATASSSRLSNEFAPALEELVPQAHAFAPALRQTQDFFRDTEPTLRNELRPFAEQISPSLEVLGGAAKPFEQSVRGFRDTIQPLNYGFNELAYNPPGPSEGYLFYLPWLNHNINAQYLTQDAAGPIRHSMVLLSCNTSFLADGFAGGREFLRTLLQVINIPAPSKAC